MALTANPYVARLDALALECPKELGTSAWTAVSSREADVFDRLVGQPIDFTQHPPGPVRPAPVNPFQLLGLVSNFSSELGIPVPTDEYVTMLNYGFDEVQWHGPVEAGARIRAHVVLTEVRKRADDQYLMIKRHRLFAESRPEPVMTAYALGLAVLL